MDTDLQICRVEKIGWAVGIDKNSKINVVPFIANNTKSRIKILTTGDIVEGRNWPHIHNDIFFKDDALNKLGLNEHRYVRLEQDNNGLAVVFVLGKNIEKKDIVYSFKENDRFKILTLKEIFELSKHLEDEITFELFYMAEEEKKNNIKKQSAERLERNTFNF